MKKIFLSLALMVSTIAFSQSVNDVPLKDIDTDYMQIVGTSKFLSSKLTIEIDFGQKTSFFTKSKETVLKDQDGNIVEFNSMIDALNFFSSNGFEFVQAYVITVQNQNVYHYLLRKKV